MKHIGNLRYAEGSKHSKKRIGRGQGSGYGGTSTRGHKGQRSRSGYSMQRGFEGGQMPLNRRLPKFGFHNRNRVEYQILNVGDLQRLIEANKISADETVGFDKFYEIGAISKKNLPLKILGDGEITSPVKIEVHKISETAKEKIEKAGGAVKIYG